MKQLNIMERTNSGFRSTLNGWCGDLMRYMHHITGKNLMDRITRLPDRNKTAVKFPILSVNPVHRGGI